MVKKMNGLARLLNNLRGGFLNRYLISFHLYSTEEIAPKMKPASQGEKIDLVCPSPYVGHQQDQKFTLQLMHTKFC
ncbi:hypothetical protein Hdeb2414_s0008g00293211 [Helianthus debilis subsp. tardiflorus]